MARNRRISLSLSAAALVLAAGVVVTVTGQNISPGQWSISGRDLSDTRSQPSETTISSSNVSALTAKWVFTTSASVSATPTVAGDLVYFPDWGGHIYAVDRNSGRLKWSRKVSDYVGIAGDLSRVSPAVYGNELIFGDNQINLGVHNGAYLMAVNRLTGELLWKRQIDPHPAAVVTGPAVVFDNVVYQGISSTEETLARKPDYPCCTFRGSVVALNARTGEMLWQTYDMPDNKGNTDQYSGGAIWQEPVIDPGRHVLYVGTGNNYTAPASVLACQTAHPAATNCAAPNDYFDTAMALDLQSGAVRWSHRLWGYDVWTVACIVPGAKDNCESPAGPDYDLGGSGGNLLGSLVGFGQKSGIYWALNPENGALLWGTPVGPGGTLGGIEWGTATDGTRIYVAIGNNGHKAYKLISGQTVTGGAWSALDPATGKILWQTADPTSDLDTGSVSVANGVVFAGSLSGHMYALEAATGKILWSFASGGSVIDGPSIVDGVLYWGSGYARLSGTGNNKVYAFTVPSHAH
ncbi:MAG: PQQ-binding-like beta-propeller repeat protein [Acidobacteriota bacterium]